MFQVSRLNQSVRRMPKTLKSLLTRSSSGGGFSATAPAKVAPPQSNKTASKNAVVAFGLLAFTGGVYYTAINKMRPEGDELGKVIEEMNPNTPLKK